MTEKGKINLFNNSLYLTSSFVSFYKYFKNYKSDISNK